MKSILLILAFVLTTQLNLNAQSDNWIHAGGGNEVEIYYNPDNCIYNNNSVTALIKSISTPKNPHYKNVEYTISKITFYCDKTNYIMEQTTFYFRNGSIKTVTLNSPDNFRVNSALEFIRDNICKKETKSENQIIDDRWVYIKDNDGGKVYIDKNTIEKNLEEGDNSQNIIYNAYVKNIYPEKTVVTYFTFYCSKKEFMISDYIIYDKNNNQIGGLTEEEKVNNMKKRIFPDTIIEYIFNLVCAKEEYFK